MYWVMDLICCVFCRPDENHPLLNSQPSWDLMKEIRGLEDFMPQFQCQVLCLSRDTKVRKLNLFITNFL